MTKINPSTKDVVSLDGEPQAPTGSVLKSASSYARSRRKAVETAKAGRVPLGGAPELDREKMNHLADGLREVKETMDRPPLWPPKSEAPDEHPINRVAMGGNPDGSPMTMAQAKAAAAQEIQEEREELTLDDQMRQFLEEDRRKAEELSQAQEGVDEVEQSFESAQNTVAAGAPQMPGLEAPEELDQMRRVLYDPERKRIIEDTLSPINFGDLVMHGEAEQEITIIPGQFSVTMRTLKQYENMHCLQLMFGMEGSPAYVQETLNMYRLTCSLVAVNGSVLPDHRKHVGDLMNEAVDAEAFRQKFEILCRMPTPVIADIGVQYDWLITRVNNLLSVDNLKNG